MAMHKGLKQCLTGVHIQYAAGKLVYSAKQNESKWEYLFRGLMDRIWVDESVQAYSINPTIIHEWSIDIIQALKINQIFQQLPPVLQRDQKLFERSPIDLEPNSITAKRAWIKMVHNAMLQYRRYHSWQQTLHHYWKSNPKDHPAFIKHRS